MKSYFVLLDSLEIRFIGEFDNSLEAMDFYEEVFGANDRDEEDLHPLWFLGMADMNFLRGQIEAVLGEAA